MNILFYTNYYPDYLIGGIERITSRLSYTLKSKGYKTYSLYTNKYNGLIRDLIFDDILYIAAEDILNRKDFVCDYIKGKNINIIIIQSIWDNIEFIQYIRFNCKCKIIYVYHSLPGYEYDWVTYKNNVLPLLDKVLKESKSWSSFIYGIKLIKRSIITTKNWNDKINDIYRYFYNNSDSFVLLSSSFLNIMRKNADLGERLTFIPNMLSYDYFLDEQELTKKEYVVLIVSRMHEAQKKISKALKFWKEIEKERLYDNWRLEIVGEGPNLEEYQQYAKGHLERVTFWGKQEPKDYYKRASIFLMTSAYEGFGITLTEAQQFGCVPIVLNTFSAAKDIISDGDNGFLVDSDRQYIKKLKFLMSDDTTRESMAKSAIKSSQKFCKENVTKMWIDLFDTI